MAGRSEAQIIAMVDVSRRARLAALASNRQSCGCGARRKRSAGDEGGKMKGAGELVLYLDFDGVLHHENCRYHPRRGAYLEAPDRYSLFQHAPLLEQLLAPYPDLQIVLSTSWVLRYGCADTAKRLPSTLQARVIGATFHSRYMNDDDFRYMPRGKQVTEDAMRRRPRGWLAVDDNDEGWPPEHKHRHILTHMYEGIGAPAVRAEFEQKLKQMCTPPCFSSAGPQF